MQIVEGTGVTKYFGGLAAVLNVDFHVNQDEITGLIGPNGAGKTTLFNLISGTFPLNSGLIRFKGKKVTGLKPNQICRLGISRTFQSVKIFGHMSVLENVLLGALFGKSGSKSLTDATREAAQCLELVGISAVRTTSAKDLTLANQKRVEVARALATKPELLMLDELMAGFNPTEVAQAMELVNRIREKGITVLMVEHVMKAIMSVCDRIMVLHHGEKITEGTPQEIAANKTVIELYLGE